VAAPAEAIGRTTVKSSRLLAILTALGACLPAAIVSADPCLVVYPAGTCTYHYSPSEYYVVSAGHPLYDPLYDRGGQVLLSLGSNAIDRSVYQPPQLAGFVPDTANQGFEFVGSETELVVDGYANTPTTYSNVLLVFDRPQPTGCTPTVTVNGLPVAGGKFSVGDLLVQTPVGYGNSYSDTVTRHIAWSGCAGLRIWAFADEDLNGVRTGGECFTAFSHDTAVPATDAIWGSLKAQYR
jgi:hypothetical protein